jgi:hypothetical protein
MFRRLCVRPGAGPPSSSRLSESRLVAFRRQGHNAFVAGLSSAGRVGEWLKPTDCKSVRPCGVRRFESFPVHHQLKCSSRQLKCSSRADVAQLVERVLGKDEVTSSILVIGSRLSFPRWLNQSGVENTPTQRRGEKLQG